jgi:hypothetical protein
MPQFTPWTVQSPFPNVLYNPAAVDKAVLGNQALAISNDYAPRINQLALDTGAIANQFSTQKNPLEIQSLRQQLGLDPNPNRDQIMRLFSGDGTAPASTAGGGGGGGGGDSTTETADDLTRAAAVRDGLIKRGMQPDGATAFAANALHESKANPFTGAGDAGASHGIFQWNGDRLAAFKAANGGLLPEQTSLDKQLDFVVSELRGPEAVALGRIMGAQGVGDKAGQVSEAYLRPKDTVPEMQRRSATALRLARAWGGQAAPGAATPTAAAPGVTHPTGVGPAIGAPGGPNITPGMTNQAWLDEMAKRYPGLAGPNDTSQRPNEPAQPPAPYQVASNAPVPPPGPAAPSLPSQAPSQGYTDPETGLPVIDAPNQIYRPGAPGLQARTTPLAPQDATPPRSAPTAAPTAAPPQTSALPRAADVPSGMNRPEVQQAQQLLRRATQIELLASQTPKDLATQQAAKVAADNLRQRAQLLLQADSVVQTQEGQFHPMTGKIDDPVKPLANYHETSPGSGIWVGGPGTEPRFQPPGRLVVGPDGTVWETGVGGAKVLDPSNPQAISARKAAESLGTETGKDVAKQLPALVEQGRNATQAIGNIDYGMSQLAKASQGGINTGYFSGALTEVQSALKSLGLPTDKIPFINVDPSAIGNIQTARKTLAIVSSAILKQALGDSQITDAKIQHFIHAQPGIETDPQALGRVLNWARSQFVYENEQSRAAVTQAATSPTGTLPLNWQATYYRDHGFAPIYDPGTGEMRQPDGTAPGRQPPPAPLPPPDKRPPLSSFAR